MALISLAYLFSLILDCTIFLQFNNAVSIACSRNWKKRKNQSKKTKFGLTCRSKYVCCSNGEWAWETADKSNFLRKMNEQPLHIPAAFQSKTSFKELASTPCTTFFILFANKMVDNLKSCVSEIHPVIDSFDLKHVNVFFSVVYLSKEL